MKFGFRHLFSTIVIVISLVSAQPVLTSSSMARRQSLGDVPSALLPGGTSTSSTTVQPYNTLTVFYGNRGPFGHKYNECIPTSLNGIAIKSISAKLPTTCFAYKDADCKELQQLVQIFPVVPFIDFVDPIGISPSIAGSIRCQDAIQQVKDTVTNVGGGKQDQVPAAS